MEKAHSASLRNCFGCEIMRNGIIQVNMEGKD